MVDLASKAVLVPDFGDEPWHYVPALMLFPGAPDAQIEFLNAMVASALKDVLAETSMQDEPIALDAPAAWWAIEYGGRWPRVEAEATAPAARDSKGVSGVGHGGPLAGLTMLIPLIMARRYPPSRPGRGAAYRLFMPRRHPSASERTLQANWMRYRSVAHLWAAFVLLGGFPGDRRELEGFVALAQELRSEVAAYVPIRDRDPLLPDNVAIDLSLIDWGIGSPLRALPDWIDHVELPAEVVAIAQGD